MFFKNKTVIVTGGAGFVGTHLCRSLVAQSAKVIVIDNYIMGSKDNHIDGVDYREGHTKSIKSLIKETVDYIFHLGEYSRVEASFNEPELVWDLNIAGTFSVVEFWREQNKTHKCKIIYAGSSTKFADGGMGRDQSPYAWTKASNTELVRNYAEWFLLPYAITYFYNVYGPGERRGRYGTVIEIFKNKRQNDEPILITAPGTQRRIFTHVEDIVSGLLLVGEKGEGDEFGLGAENDFSILEVAEIFGGPIEMKPEAKGNRMNAKLDLSRSHALGWRAKYHLPNYINNIF